MQLLRTAVMMTTDTAVVATGGCFGKKKDLLPEEFTKLLELHEESYLYHYMLDYRSLIAQTVDFSDMWFREYYLEVSRQVQCIYSGLRTSQGAQTLMLHRCNSLSRCRYRGFSRSTSSRTRALRHRFLSLHSTCWIFTTTLPVRRKLLGVTWMKHGKAYCRAMAGKALYSMRKQFLYDEIEAEVNLVFDQLTYLISDDIYSYFKNRAASLVLDKVPHLVPFNSVSCVLMLFSSLNQLYKQRLDVAKHENYFQQPHRRFHIPLRQRHIKLLGRTIDLNHIVAQHVNDKLMSDTELVIKVSPPVSPLLRGVRFPERGNLAAVRVGGTVQCA
jgi:cytoplasmic FMR1 interacting protein